MAVPTCRVWWSGRIARRRVLGRLQAIALVCAALGVAPIVAVAQSTGQSAALPANLAAEIDHAAARRQARLKTEPAVYARLDNPQLYALVAGQIRSGVDAELAGVVVGAIARRPDLASAIVARAEAAAPGSAQAVRAATHAAYPGLFESAAGARQARPPQQGWYGQANLAAYTPAAGAAGPARGIAPSAPAIGRYDWYDQPVLRRYRGVAATAYQPPIRISQPVVPEP